MGLFHVIWAFVFPSAADFVFMYEICFAHAIRFAGYLYGERH